MPQHIDPQIGASIFGDSNIRDADSGSRNTTFAPLETVQGVIQQVDLVQREVSVLAGARRLLVDIPPECPVVLRGERIKLRLVQPGDVVRMRVLRNQRAIAQRVEVASGNSLPALGEV